MSDQNQKTTTVAGDPNFFNRWPMSTPLDVRLVQTNEIGINSRYDGELSAHRQSHPIGLSPTKMFQGPP